MLIKASRPWRHQKVGAQLTNYPTGEDRHDQLSDGETAGVVRNHAKQLRELLAADHPTGSGGRVAAGAPRGKATKPSVTANESLMTCVASASLENRDAAGRSGIFSAANNPDCVERSSIDISLPRARHDFHIFQRQATADLLICGTSSCQP